MLRLLSLIICLTAAVCVCLPAATAEEPVHFKVAVTVCDDHSEDAAIVDNFLGHLRKAFPRGSFTVRRFEVHELEPWVKNGEVDIFLSNSGLYRTLINYGVKDIATATSPLFPNPNEGDGSVWIARSDRTDIASPGNFRGRVLSTKGPDAQIWYFAAVELAAAGMDPEKVFSSVRYVGHETSKVIDDVREGRADIGILPACFMEKYEKIHPEAKGVFKFVGLRSGYPCAVSTRLYPNWTVAITPSMPPNAARDITASLLNSGRDARGIGWSVATHFDLADRMLRTLRVGQYTYLRDWTVRRLLDKYGFLIGVASALLLALLVYALYARKLIARRSAQLTEVLRTQDEYRQQFESALASYEALRRMGILTQASNVLAHELRQPLNAIELFAHGLLRRLRDARAAAEDVIPVIEQIREQVAYADGIVSRVREFTRSGPKRRLCSLEKIVDTAASHFMLCSHSFDRLEKMTEPVEITADPFEIELLLVNLLNNGSEALEEARRTDPVLKIECRREGSSAVLAVSDNGRSLSEREVERIRSAFFTTRIKGTGVGLSIVKEITESYGGSLDFRARPEGGLQVTVRLPLEGKEK